MCPHALIGQMSVGQVSVDQMSVGQVSVGQMSVGQVSVDQMSVGQVSVGQTGVAQVSGYREKDVMHGVDVRCDLLHVHYFGFPHLHSNGIIYVIYKHSVNRFQRGLHTNSSNASKCKKKKNKG